MYKSSIMLCLLLVGCNNSDMNDPKYKPAPKGKYKITECGLKIELQWKEKNRAYKIEVLNEVPKTFKKYSYSYYIDSSLTDSSLNNIIFIFHNHCEKKEEMLKTYAEKHLEDIKNFPKYTIVPYTPKIDKNNIPIYDSSASQ